jgi:hypothetical protein
VGHYELLGVDAEASMGEIRAAYVALARENHPDRHVGDEGRRLRAETKMRELNAAWAALGSVEARSAYDRSRLETSRSASRPRHADVGDATEWRPYVAGGVDGFDERDDRPITSGGLPPWLTLAPPLLFFGGLIGFVIGGFIGIMPIVALAATSVVLSVALFLIAPLVAMAASRREDTGA